MEKIIISEEEKNEILTLHSNKRIKEDEVDNFKKRAVNITKIIENGDRFERKFFQWLNNNNIGWFQKGSNLNYIQLIDKEKDFPKIKEIWDEVESI